jgi:hypothetical protein
MKKKPAPLFVLNEAERASHLWRRLKEHMEATRQELRETNDSPLLDDARTSDIRGRIGQLNDLLALDDPVPGAES